MTALLVVFAVVGGLLAFWGIQSIVSNRAVAQVQQRAEEKYILFVANEKLANEEARRNDALWSYRNGRS